MKKTIVISLLTAACTSVFGGWSHRVPGLTPQDEAVASALDAGLSQSAYLQMGYGESAADMLAAAFEARAECWRESAAVIRSVSKGDIRNVPCVDPDGGDTNSPYVVFALRHKVAMFSPDDAMPHYGRMFLASNAFERMVKACENRSRRQIRFIGATNNLAFYHAFDDIGRSYSFWPLGVAVHEPDGYAEEVAHFMNFQPPRAPVPSYAGSWSDPDYARVTMWNEFLSALRGVKVHAFSLGINLNEPDSFTNYYNTVSADLDGWSAVTTNTTVYTTFDDNDVEIYVTNKTYSAASPVSLNAYILLKAYREAAGKEDTPADDAAYLRFRKMCRDPRIARMVL